MAKGRRVGRPVLADPDETDHAVHPRDRGETIAQIITTGVPRTSLYRHPPPRPVEPVTADGGRGEQRDQAG